MKTPKSIQAVAIIDKDNLLMKSSLIYSKKDMKDVVVMKEEKKCLVEIKFIKYIK